MSFISISLIIRKMNDILIAYNSRPDDDAHNFFQSCADEVRQACADLGHGCSIKTRDELTEQVIMQSMTSHSLCVFAAHGSSDSIVNENDDEVISTRTTNYVFKGKGLYAISCSCASSLLPELSRIGISIFVGYDDDFRLSGDAGVFVNCALSGFRSFAEGKSFGQAQSDMLASFDEAIRKAGDSSNPFEKMLLLRDKESLVFHGEPETTFSDLI